MAERMPYKRSRLLTERLKASAQQCEVCGWRDPGGNANLLHADHVVPVSCGGLDEATNILVLCPNHHAIAHAIKLRYLPKGAARSERMWVHSGPKTRDALSAAIYHYEKHRGTTTVGHCRNTRTLIESLRPRVAPPVKTSLPPRRFVKTGPFSWVAVS